MGSGGGPDSTERSYLVRRSVDIILAIPVDGPEANSLSAWALPHGTPGTVTQALFGSSLLSPLRISLVTIIPPFFLTSPHAMEYLFCRRRWCLRHLLFSKYPRAPPIPIFNSHLPMSAPLFWPMAGHRKITWRLRNLRAHTTL